jgi:uncharacterized protein YabE (DUF348 family)
VDAVRESPARSEPHDATAWLPLPFPELLTPVDELVGPDAATADASTAAPEAPEQPASPARAEPHDATAWLPLPDFDELPSIHELLTPDPDVEAPARRDLPAYNPSPARAEPHDATAWLPLPETDALPDIAELAEPTEGEGGGGRRHRRTRRRMHIPFRAMLVAALVIGMLGGVYWGATKILDPGADVSLRVDGRVISAETGVSTVGSLLAEQKVELGENDKVVPAPSAAIENDMTVRVLRAFPVTVDVDGTPTPVFATASNPKQFLRELNLGPKVELRDPPKRIEGDSTVLVRTARTGTLTVDGETVTFDAPAATVRELLEDYDVVLGPTDFTTPIGLDEPLTDGLILGVTRSVTDTVQRTEPYTLPDERQPDPNMSVLDADRVVPGTPGVHVVTYAITQNNGYQVGEVPIATAPIAGQEATPTITYFGTGYNPLWDKMARCETGGNWAASGQKYQGGLGIYFQNWNHYGGRAFAPTGGQATKLEQIIVAERIRAEHGWRAWGCAREIGL